MKSLNKTDVKIAFLSLVRIVNAVLIIKKSKLRYNNYKSLKQCGLKLHIVAANYEKQSFRRAEKSKNMFMQLVIFMVNTSCLKS
ncbi:hypothetical protein BCR26_16725 [Enterococcus rivorum]|uniref:Uncharacterized protein n=1 Tax=Enterococcus rivorum TaxID=762845 RepID=A0A1E5KUX3_9ENTE|nr:hypothetical protein BCR26_16725 [Enterococcus rivorum]